MNQFEFKNPTKLIFGQQQLDKLPREIPTSSKVLIIYGGKSAKKSGLINEVKTHLTDFEYGEFGGISPNPTYENLMNLVELVKLENYTFLLAVGGGSVIDATKFVAAATLFDQGDPVDMLIKQIPATKAIPIGTILTLSGTGTEMNGEAVISVKKEGSKIPFQSPAIYPMFSILDPSYTYSAPLEQVSNGIVDTFVHIMEQYLTYPVNAKVQDRFAEGLLMTLIEEGPKAIKQPTNYDVRANLMLTSTLAINGLIGSGVPQDWSTHMIGHCLTAFYGIDHGKTMGIILPAMLEIQRVEKREKLLQYAERVWGLTDKSDETITLAIQKTRDFFESLGSSTRLTSYSLGEEIIPDILRALEPLAALNIKLGENGTLTLDKVAQVIQLAV